MRDATWDDGRLARITHGEWEGCLALVTEFAAESFLVYVAEEDGPRRTDFLGGSDEAALVSHLGLEWLPPDEDRRLEDKVFGLRRHWRQQRERQALPWWRRYGATRRYRTPLGTERRCRPSSNPRSFPNVEQPPPADEALISLLQERDGRSSVVLLRDGRRLDVRNIAWGYDIGDEYAHVITNISPSVAGQSVDFFYTSDVTAVLDENGVPVHGE